jgi:hypothetical protein
MSTLDGSIARESSADFVLFHAGAAAILANPSPRTANVTLTFLSAAGVQSLSIPAKGRIVTTLTGAVRVQSSEALAAIERLGGPGKLAINTAAPVADGRATLVFPHALAGDGYTSTLTLANVGREIQNLTVTFGGSTTTLELQPNEASSVSIASLLQTGSGAVTVTAAPVVGQAAIVGVLDIESQNGLTTIGARPAASGFVFPYVANGDGLFTGLAFATGGGAASITIDVYPPGGGPPKSATITLDANQQLGRLVSELVNGTGTQLGGYIRVRSDQPIWAWEIYGSLEAMASGPPL